MQEQDPAFWFTLQIAFTPQGVGEHGLDWISWTWAKKVNILKMYLSINFWNLEFVLVIFLTLLLGTLYKWIASKSDWTNTDSSVTHNITQWSQATGSDTRICTSVVDTSKLVCTIRIRGTLWSTIRRWVNVVWKTRAWWWVIDYSAPRIWTTGRWLTGVNDRRWCFSLNKKLTIILLLAFS